VLSFIVEIVKKNQKQQTGLMRRKGHTVVIKAS